MKNILTTLLFGLLLFCNTILAADRNIDSVLIIQQSPFSVKATADRIEKLLNEQKVQLFARIKHSEAAEKANLKMPDEELLIFGSPKVGTPLMIESPAIGIELPLKIIIWEKNNQTYIGYQQLASTLAPYGIERNKETIIKMQTFLQNLVAKAIQY